MGVTLAEPHTWLGRRRTHEPGSPRCASHPARRGSLIMPPTVAELRDAYNTAADRVQASLRAIDDVPDDAEADTFDPLNAEVEEATEEAERAKALFDQAETRERARATFKPLAVEKAEERITVREPDMYEPHGKHMFLRDVYMRDMRNDPLAAGRLAQHQAYEMARMEKE